MPPSAGGHPGMEHGDAQLQQLPPTAENLGKRKHLRHHARPLAAPGHPNLNQDVPILLIPPKTVKHLNLPWSRRSPGGF